MSEVEGTVAVPTAESARERMSCADRRPVRKKFNPKRSQLPTQAETEAGGSKPG